MKVVFERFGQNSALGTYISPMTPTLSDCTYLTSCSCAPLFSDEDMSVSHL